MCLKQWQGVDQIQLGTMARLQMAPSNSLVGSAIRESIRRAQVGGRRNVPWAGRYMSMSDMISGQGSRESDNTIHNNTACCGYDAS
jgi:hypothetical protein